MAFQSLYNMKVDTRQKKTRAGKPKPSIIFRQSALSDGLRLTIRIKEEITDKARIKEGDKVDVLYSPEENRYMLSYVPNQKYGYKLSRDTNSVMRLQFRHYEPMPLIADKSVRLAHAHVDESSIKFETTPGQVSFALKKAVIKKGTTIDTMIEDAD